MSNRGRCAYPDCGGECAECMTPDQLLAFCRRLIRESRAHEDALTRARAEARAEALGPVTELIAAGEALRRLRLRAYVQAEWEAATSRWERAIAASRRDAVEPAGNDDWHGSG